MAGGSIWPCADQEWKTCARSAALTAAPVVGSGAGCVDTFRYLNRSRLGGRRRRYGGVRGRSPQPREAGAGRIPALRMVLATRLDTLPGPGTGGAARA
ncbi:hypothetical protein GCM10023324_12670 [Streptomyces youssoufiensis]